MMATAVRKAAAKAASAVAAASASGPSNAALSVRRLLLEHGPLHVRQLAKMMPLEHFKSLTHLKNGVLGELERHHGVRRVCLRSETGKRVWAWELRKPYFDPEVPSGMAGPGTANPPKKPSHATTLIMEAAKAKREAQQAAASQAQ